jgi:hypothetical protein
MRARTAFALLVAALARAAAASSGEAEGEARPRAEVLRDAPLTVALPGRAWAVLVDLPGFAAEPPRPTDDGGGVAALAADTASNAVASVVLTPAGPARDARGCRDRDLGRIRARVRGGKEVRTSEAPDGAARARYVVAGAGPGARGGATATLHAHAWRFRDAVCVNVHLSTADPGAGDEARLARLLDTVRIAESL